MTSAASLLVSVLAAYDGPGRGPAPGPLAGVSIILVIVVAVLLIGGLAAWWVTHRRR